MKKAAGIIGAAAFWIAVWFAAALSVGKEVLLPSPLDTVKSLITLASHVDYWISCLFSLIRIMAGLCAGALCGIFTAALTCRSKIANALISPILSIIRATPVASFIILALVWLGRTVVPSFAAFLMVTPVVWNSVASAVSETDRNLIEMTEAFGIRGISRLRHLYIPSVAPSLTAGLRTSMGLAWKAGVAAEVLCTPESSIGTRLYSSKIYLETSDLFAWTATVIILSVLFEKLLDSGLRALQIRSERKARAQNG